MWIIYFPWSSFLLLHNQGVNQVVSGVLSQILGLNNFSGLFYENDSNTKTRQNKEVQNLIIIISVSSLQLNL